MIARGGKPCGIPRKSPCPVPDGGGLAMHQAIGADDLPP